MEVPLPSGPITESYRRAYLDRRSPFSAESSYTESKSRRGCYRVSDKLLHCELCDKSYTRPGDLRNHYRKKHDIGFPSDKAKHSQKEGSCSLAETRDDRTTKPMQSNLCGDYLRETSPLQISKGDSGGTPVTVGLIRRLESCLSELSSQSTKGFRIPLVVEIDGVATNMNIDMYKSHILPTDSGTTQLGPFVGDVKRSESESRPEQLQLPPPLPRQVFNVRFRHASLPMDHDNMDAVMAQQPIPTIEAPEIMSNPHTPLILPPLENSSHSSSEDEDKLMGYQEYDTTKELHKAKVSKKRKNPDDDASHCSGSLVDSSEEGDDSDYECDNIITWNYSQHDALPSFLSYIRGYDENTSSPCSDSPESGSNTSGTPRDTPASSSASGLAGVNGLQRNGYTPPSAGTGLPDNGNNPVLETKEEFGAKVADPLPLPLICWYPAAGIACTSKHVKTSIETRHLWNDHAWGKNRKAPNHRLSDACQQCKRLFLTQQLLGEHVDKSKRQGGCRALSDAELKEFNREPNRLGISLECEDAVEKIRNYINKGMRGKKLPAFRDGDIEKLLNQRVDVNVLNQRVDSNVLLYINGSNTNEKTARSELWKWYLIFKKLRPDDELPRNPFIPAQHLAEPEGRFRADALRTFMHVFDQRRTEGCLPQLDDDQRTALSRVFLDTLDMLDANEASKRHQSIQTRNPRKRQKRSPPEDHELAPDSTDPALAPTTPARTPWQLLQQQQEEPMDACLLLDVDNFDFDRLFGRLSGGPQEL